MTVDILIKNGRCLSLDQNRVYDWLAITEDKIVALGYGDPETQGVAAEEVIDAKHGSVLPGFYDNSIHLVQTATNSLRPDLSQAKSFDDIGDLITEEMKKKPGQPIFAYGLDELNLREKRLPDRYVLDRFCSSVPLWLSRREYHTSVLNTHGLLYYKIPFTLSGIELGDNTLPTGIFTLYANAKLREIILNSIPASHHLSAADNIMPKLLKEGITTIAAMEGGFTFCDKDADFVHQYKDTFPLDITLFIQTTNIAKIKEMGLNRIGGSLFLDGAFGSRNAALSQSYEDNPGNRGRLYYSDEELNAFVLDCYENQLQLAVHAIGERAIEQIIRAHKKASEKTGIYNLRHRIEHGELPTQEHISTAKQLGLIFSMQPAYEYYWGGPDKMYARRLGDRFQRTNPFHALAESGVVICGGSDSDVTPASPLLGIHAAVNHPVPEHSVDVVAAIKMFTKNGAYALFEESRKGTLKKGYQADVVILDQDLLTIPAHTIIDATVETTIKSGNILYRKEKGL